MSSCRQIALMSLLVMGLLTERAWAQQSPPDSRVHTPWFVQANFGTARIHSWDPRAGWVEARIGRTIGSRSTSIDLGVALSSGRPEFGSLTSGFEVRPWPLARFSPFVRGEVGFLGESDFGGAVAGSGGGLILRVGSRIGLRMGVALNVHGGEKGPVTSYGGLEYRW